MSYIEHTRTNVRIQPDLQAAIDTNTSYTSGQIKSRALDYGQHLGTGRVAAMVEPEDLPGYTLMIKLRSSADFLHVEVQ